MDFDSVFDLLKSRRSVRKFTDQKPSREQIERLVEAACWAPSNHNRQGWKFLVFGDEKQVFSLADRVRRSLREKLGEVKHLTTAQKEELVYFAGAFEKAPVMILAMHKKPPAMAKSLLASAAGACASGEILSTAMAVGNLLIGAEAMGLATCVMTAPLLAGEVWDTLEDLPTGYEHNCIVALGYAGESPEAPRRKQLRHVIEYR
jgi:nitroreductase